MLWFFQCNNIAELAATPCYFSFLQSLMLIMLIVTHIVIKVRQHIEDSLNFLSHYMVIIVLTINLLLGELKTKFSNIKFTQYHYCRLKWNTIIFTSYQSIVKLSTHCLWSIYGTVVGWGIVDYESELILNVKISPHLYLW